LPAACPAGGLSRPRAGQRPRAGPPGGEPAGTGGNAGQWNCGGAMTGPLRNTGVLSPVKHRRPFPGRLSAVEECWYLPADTGKRPREDDREDRHYGDGSDELLLELRQMVGDRLPPDDLRGVPKCLAFREDER